MENSARRSKHLKRYLCERKKSNLIECREKFNFNEDDEMEKDDDFWVIHLLKSNAKKEPPIQ